MNSLQSVTITPLEKRPCHPDYARARGLTESYESVFVLQGFTDGHIHSPIEVSGRYFRAFARHKPEKRALTVVQVLSENPKSPFKGGDLSKYDGIISIYENVSKVRRPAAGKAEAGKPIWTIKNLEITMVEPVTGAESTIRISDALAWRSGSDATQAQLNVAMPFSLKAVELTATEIAAHKKVRGAHAAIPL
jgi:hypothetical protein